MKKKIIAFSGTLRLTEKGSRIIRFTLGKLGYADEYVTGAAIGVDAEVGTLLTRLCPAAVHTVIVPADRKAVDAWWTRLPYQVEKLRVVYMPPGTSYRDRNQELVDRATMLVAYPAFPEVDLRSRRSGTWQTVRMARRAEKPVKTYVLHRVTYSTNLV